MGRCFNVVITRQTSYYQIDPPTRSHSGKSLYSNNEYIRHVYTDWELNQFLVTLIYIHSFCKVTKIDIQVIGKQSLVLIQKMLSLIIQKLKSSF